MVCFYLKESIEDALNHLLVLSKCLWSERPREPLLLLLQARKHLPHVFQAFSFAAPRPYLRWAFCRNVPLAFSRRLSPPWAPQKAPRKSPWLIPPPLQDLTPSSELP